MKLKKLVSGEKVTLYPNGVATDVYCMMKDTKQQKQAVDTAESCRNSGGRLSKQRRQLSKQRKQFVETAESCRNSRGRLSKQRRHAWAQAERLEPRP